MHTNSKIIRRFFFSFKCLLATSSLVFGCTSTSEDSTDTVVAVPTVNIVSPKSGECASLVKTEDGEWLRASYFITNWNLRPKGYCSIYGVTQCGFAVAFVDGTPFVDASGGTVVSSLVIEIPRTSFSASTSHTLRVELHTDDDLIAVDPAGNPLLSEVSFTLPPSGSLTCASTDASDSDGSDAEAGDASVEAEASVDAEVDTKADTQEASTDAGIDGSDSSADVTLDSVSDAPADSSSEAEPETGTDSALDGGVEADVSVQG